MMNRKKRDGWCLGSPASSTSASPSSESSTPAAVTTVGDSRARRNGMLCTDACVAVEAIRAPYPVAMTP